MRTSEQYFLLLTCSLSLFRLGKYFTLPLYSVFEKSTGGLKLFYKLCGGKKRKKRSNHLWRNCRGKREHLWWCPFLVKFKALTFNITKNRTSPQLVPVNFLNFFKNSYFKEHLKAVVFCMLLPHPFPVTNVVNAFVDVEHVYVVTYWVRAWDQF